MTDATEETSERKERRRGLENQEKIRSLKESLIKKGSMLGGNIIMLL